MKTFTVLLNIFVFFSFLTISFIGTSSMVQSQAPVFFSVIDDLPLMPGLQEDTDRALSFDTANGRIAEIAASGLVEAGVIIDYYARTLPQLGWKLNTLDRYIRGDEYLKIEVVKSKGGRAQVAVYFRLSPTGEK